MSVEVETIGGHVLYRADCRDIMSLMGDGSVDAVVTDPPYGISKQWKGGKGHGWGSADAVKKERNTWDDRPPSQAVINIILSISKVQIIWGGNHFNLPCSRGWLIWVKPERNFTLGEAELAWTNRSAVIRVCESPRSESDRKHPTQKPVPVMVWCLGFIPDAQTIFDPYMGSGSTGVAAQRTGRQFIGVERERKYFDIACERIERECAQGVLPLEGVE